METTVIARYKFHICFLTCLIIHSRDRFRLFQTVLSPGCKLVPLEGSWALHRVRRDEDQACQLQEFWGKEKAIVNQCAPARTKQPSTADHLPLVSPRSSHPLHLPKSLPGAQPALHTLPFMENKYKKVLTHPLPPFKATVHTQLCVYHFCACQSDSKPIDS